MKIGMVEKTTGLSAKAIRLYEEKGLISVSREENQYGVYDDESVKRLSLIKQLRDAGISIEQIALFFGGIIDLDELISKRLDQIKKENSINCEQVAMCEQILQEGDLFHHLGDICVKKQNHTVAVGIDIGTTNISVTVLDILSREVLEVYSVQNLSGSDSPLGFREFDADWVLLKVKQLVKYLCSRYEKITSLGITGQMHGVVCVDRNGKAVTPFYNWQDFRANEKRNGVTYCELIKEKTGFEVFAGYGAATLYYNHLNGLLPQNAHSFATIMDYVAAALAGKSEIVMHPSNAASIGLFDLRKNDFEASAFQTLGLPLVLPRVTKELCVIGAYHGIPITVPIGDNQASVYGSIQEEQNMLLVNYGTGSQISAVVESVAEQTEELDIRPYVNGDYILCGCALCGGKSYEILEKFFSEYARYLGGSSGTQYELMNRMSEQAYQEKTMLHVSTTFLGTRKQPERKGEILGISPSDFSPKALVLGVLQGIVNELFDFYKAMRLEGGKRLVASGNIVQKNPVLRLLLRDTFGCKVELVNHREEAAFGAALCGLVSAGILDHKGAKEFISYKEEENV